jgi:hypothetical protein
LGAGLGLVEEARVEPRGLVEDAREVGAEERGDVDVDVELVEDDMADGVVWEEVEEVMCEEGGDVVADAGTAKVEEEEDVTGDA